MGLQFQIQESRLNNLRAFDLITRIGRLETEGTIGTKEEVIKLLEITSTKVRNCQFRCFTNNTVNVRRFTFLSMDLSDNNLGSSKLLETTVIKYDLYYIRYIINRLHIPYMIYGIRGILP